MTAISPKEGPVAVTGCSGFTGGHMVRELVLHSYQVRACIRDASSRRGKDSVDYLSRLPNVEIIEGCDYFTQGSYNAAFEGCSGVFHVDGLGGGQPLGSGDSDQDTYDGLVAGTQNVIDAINASGSVKRLIYTSSMAAVSGAKGATLPKGYEWTETDWASDQADPEVWRKQSYQRGKVDTEHLVNAAADESDGKWDVISMCPSCICGPILFKAQVGSFIEDIGRLAAGLETRGLMKYDRNYNIIDVRDLVRAHRLAAESAVDHKATHGGSRYIMDGSGSRSTLHLNTEVTEIISQYFPEFVLGKAATVTESGEPITVQPNFSFDCKKAKSVLGVTIRPVEDTIRDVVESQIEFGIITPQLK